jgi:acetyl esterase/lipase
MRFLPLGSVAFLILFAMTRVEANEGPGYVQSQDIVYAEVHGTGLLMDVFSPTGVANGNAIIDVASGAWYSDRGKIRDHTLAQLYSTFCGRGYVVFAIRPGSKTRYTAIEMDQHVKLAIRYVKEHAEKYKINGDKLGLTGASAGGHLATLAALTPADRDSNAKNKLDRHDTTVAAVAVFFPPTDFLEWRDGKTIDPNVIAPLLAVGANSPNDGGLNGKSKEELREMAKAISPVHQVRKPVIPFLMIHGDADEVVPLSHSQKLVEAIQTAGGSAELIVKKGGGHPWLTLPVEVAVMADWFDKQLK